MKRLLSLAVIHRTLAAGTAMDVKNGVAGSKPVIQAIPKRVLFTPVSADERKDLIKLNAARELRPNEDPDNYKVFGEEATDYAARAAEAERHRQAEAQRSADEANRAAIDRRIKDAARQQREREVAAGKLAETPVELTPEQQRAKDELAARFAAASGDTDKLPTDVDDNDGFGGGNGGNEEDFEDDVVTHIDGEGDKNAEPLKGTEEVIKDPVVVEEKEPVAEAAETTEKKTRSRTRAKPAPAKKPADKDVDEDSVV